MFGLSQINYGQNVAGSAHDFTSGAGNDGWFVATSNKMCGACHTPHNASATASTPLWNHGETAVDPYTAYSGYDIDATDISGTIGGVSKLCLGCHDGTVPLDKYGPNAGTVGNEIDNYNTNAMASKLIGGSSDLSNHHPISFTYDATLYAADGGAGGLNDPDGAAVKALLVNNYQVECNSCHDVHNSTGFTKLLTVDNPNSELCLVCHNK